jgi:dihydrofolate synthase/folylpolyglutamate synthase
MPIENYEQALAFWFDRVNYEHRGMPGDLRELNLDRMRDLLARLEHPESKLRIIHVAGTKGKGSTAAMLASILRQAQLRCGLFTSPHLSHVEERVQIDGQPISPNDLTAHMRTIEPQVVAMEAAGKPPTFFEIVTALALLHFARAGVDLVVLEVGLGGRFDSTNVCTPLVSVVTNISFDHMQQLGSTLASIAREKAGIVKSGRPTISGVTAPEARTVIAEVCKRRGSTLCELGRDFNYQYSPGWIDNDRTRWPRVDIRTRKTECRDVELALLGEHQAANAAVAFACVEELRRQGWGIADAAVRRGLGEVKWPARMEVVRRRPIVILDCAHNDASMRALVDTVQSTFPPARKAIVLACSRDKDLAAITAILVPNFEMAFLTRYLSTQRSVPPEDLAELWRRGGGSCQECQTPALAWEAARNWSEPDDVLCISGSVFFAGEMRSLVLA